MEKNTETPPRHSEYDLIVIGSGPAGIHAAVQAAKLNKKVCIIEKARRKIGGSWIHTGTLPSKTLRETLDSIHGIKNHIGSTWVERVLADLQTGKLFARAREVSRLEEDLVRHHLANNHIEIIEGYGTVENRFTVRVVSSEQQFLLSTGFILLALGSRPKRPLSIPFDGWRVVDSDEIFSLENVPKTMVICGAGVIGCEYACIFAALGVQVTVVDSRSRILQSCDSEIVQELQASMRALGVKFIFDADLDQIHIKGPRVELMCGANILEADVLFYAGGRVGASNRVGLERVGIEVNGNGIIPVNKNFQTNIDNIYAAGDIVGHPSLAATASQQGRHVACHAFGINLGDFPKDFPVGIYTIPELSMVGKTEEALKQEGIDFVVGRASYNEIARGYIRGDSHGLLKLLISRETHHILGIHIVGADACNLIHVGLAFMTKNGHAQDLINMVFNYPTLAEGYRIAAFNGLNKIFTDGVIRNPPDLAK
ncbi:MAG: Si-specific NAD(P)(+) transhydrogenase [Oligoflexales bacterium]|nr:Si-specific NAD(P)(+) transhydrogenase [Oligoflexales bacterium]